MRSRLHLRPRRVVAVLAVAALALAGAGCSSDKSDNAGNRSTAVGDYPGRRSTDSVVGADFTAELAGARTLLGDFKRTTAGTTAVVCAKAHIVSSGIKTVRYAARDFTAFAPTGRRLRPVASAPDALTTGRLVEAEAVDGAVCFADPGDRGRYVVVWKPVGSARRAVWLVNL